MVAVLPWDFIRGAGAALYFKRMEWAQTPHKTRAVPLYGCQGMKKQIKSRYDKVYELVGMIPPGRVATYGQIASYIDRCTPRMVGYAMAATPPGQGIPWQRVINGQGMISIRANGERDMLQRLLLEAEGVVFNKNGRVDLSAAGWKGP